MTKQTHSQEIHALTVAEIGRQKKALRDLRAQIVEERAANYASASKSGSVAPMISADEGAAREHAKHLLNGRAPDWLSQSPGINRDNELLRQQRGIDIALAILEKDEVATRAAEAVIWAEENAEKWRALTREITLTAVKLEALERSACELLGQCGDLFAIRLPLVNIIGGRPISETPLGDLTERALAEGVVTRREIERANSHG